ncbi:hypothetical protein C1H46_013814 [Malus baccata]|uniref:Sugar phosphate transporter domain-containing protein n=1 Tax=Malus baccata TaxID=106549 RepID=A0A540MQB8_MALBA|nr:hypothetical protein C1H46_013814 [Malus baccata]
MYIAIKRLTTLAVLVAGFFSGKGRPPIQVCLSVLLTAVETMYLVLMEQSGAEDGLSSVEIMYHNSFLSLPFFMLLIVATGEFPNSLSLLIAKSNSLYFLVILILSFIMGIALNFTMFLCTIVNSALTITIVGVLKGVGSRTLGFLLLGGVQVHVLNVTGLVINTAGGVWYSFAKYQQRKSKPAMWIADVEAYRI